jgi:hypothetical protein
MILLASFALALTACSASPLPTPEPTADHYAEGIFLDAAGEAAGIAVVTRYSPSEMVAGVWSVKTPDVGDLVMVAADRVIDLDETCFDAGIALDGPTSFTLSQRTSYDLDNVVESGMRLAALALVHPTGQESGCGNELVAVANLDLGGGVPEAETLRVPEGTVVASGSFADGTGHVTGDVTVTSAGDYEFTLEITGYSSSERGELWAAGVGYPPGKHCISEPWHIDWGVPAGSAVEETIVQEDPGFIDAIVVAVRADDPTPLCGYETVGVAALEWSLPDLRPGLVVRDQGAFTDAMGKVALGSDGEPVSYRVEPSDRIEAISGRFALTMDEFIYLNPTEDITEMDPLIEYGESLNLSKDRR